MDKRFELEDDDYSHGSPYRRLLAAILLRAWEDALPPPRRKSPARRDVRMRREKVCREARAYFRSQDSRPWSYEWICLVLDIDPDPMRARLSAILAAELCAKEGMTDG